MSSKNIFTWTTPDSAADVSYQVNPIASEPSNTLDRLARYVDGMAAGALGYTNAATKIGAINATATLTVSSTGPTNGEVGTVANVNITAKTSGAIPANGEFNINASATVVATGIALAINSATALANLVSATSSLGVVTITAFTGGVEGNGLQLSAGNLANVVAVGFSGGTNGTKVVLAS